MENYHGTTILSVRRGNVVALGGDGQVTLGNIVVKASARKVRKLYRDQVLAGRAHKRGLELAGDVHPDVPDALVGDAGRLRQVLLNLVGNAIKFTEEGEVLVRVAVVGDSPPDGEAGLWFAVRDTGIGVPPDRQ